MLRNCPPACGLLLDKCEQRAYYVFRSCSRISNKGYSRIDA